MFGMTFLGIILIGSIGTYLYYLLLDGSRKKTDRVEGTDDLYWDHNMVARNIYTNRRCIVSRNSNGDLCAYDEGMHYIKNYDMERRINDLYSEDSNEKTGFFLYDPDPHRNDKVKGCRYAEYGTKRICVQRRFHFEKKGIFEIYYMDVDTLELVCSALGKPNKAVDAYIRKNWERYKMEAAKNTPSAYIYREWWNLDALL